MKTNAAEITRAALQLFAENGYRGTSIGDIERAVGLAPRAGGFYRHFESKEEVLLRGMDEYASDLVREIDTLKGLNLPSPEEELRQIALIIRDHANRHSDVRIMLRREGRTVPAVRERIRQFNQADAWTYFLEWVRAYLGRRSIDDTVRLHTFQVFSTLALLLYLQDEGEEPLGLNQDKVLDHWLNSSMAYLQVLKR